VAKRDLSGGSATADIAAPTSGLPSIDETLGCLRKAFAASAGHVVESARERSRSLERGSGSSGPDLKLLFAADALTSVALDCGWPACDVEQLIDICSELCALSREETRRAIFISAVRNPSLLDLPPRLAIEFHVQLLSAMAPLQQVTLWDGSEATRPECVVAIGAETITRRVRTVARLALSVEAEDDLQQGVILGVRILRWQRPFAALVLRCARKRERALAFARETAAALSPLFERDMLLERNARRERTLVEASEKRMARIGYDLHDGPLQEVAALLGDLRLARSQLVKHFSAPSARLVDGRMQDIEARATAIERSLRELAISLEPKHVLELPFASVVQREIEEFERRTGIEAFLEVSGDFELTNSQRLAFFRVIQEALTNVREHSDATVVHVSLEARRSCTDLRIMDNGSGFEVTRVLIDAARRGRLGLVGIGERVRMLGGTFDVISRPDEYTELIVSLPVWRPAETPDVVEQLGAV
jgi:signal transduction histidine kinase